MKSSTGFLEKSSFFTKTKVVLKHEVLNLLIKFKNIIFRKKQKQIFKIKQRYSDFSAKKIVFNLDLVLNYKNKLSWFYTAFERKDQDPLTNFVLEYVDNNFESNKNILVTGCGTGIMVFHWAEKFKVVDGIDLLDKCILIAKKIKKSFNYKNTTFYSGDSFNPSVSKTYDIITVLHWIYSAWMGNYGNNNPQKPFKKKTRENLLREFLTKYKKIINPGGILIIELIDSIADFRLPKDHKAGDESLNIYPVRHSYSDVKKIVKELDLILVDAHSCFSYGHQPRMIYIIQKLV